MSLQATITEKNSYVGLLSESVLLNGQFTEKSAGCDFDIADFDENDFECHGWGWIAELTEKQPLTAGFAEKNALKGEIS